MQEALLAWVLEPFAALDMITGGEEDDGWDFDEEPLSCYTYVSVVGGGYLVAMITAFVQITLPITLFYGVIHQEILENFESVPVCEGDGSPNNRFAILCVVLMYITTIVPSQIELFMNKVANADNAISKLNSLRQVITDKNEDTYGQKWGFKLDIFCNTAYVGILYTMNIFLVFCSADAIDIVLNAIAVEFIATLDEVVAQRWDADKRVIRAGACELVLRRYLRLHELDKLKVQHPARPAAPEMKRGSSGDHTPRRRASIDHAAQGLDVTLHQDSLRRTLKQSDDERFEKINAIADAHMEKKPFGFGILTVLHLRQGAVLFERHGAYIDDINWDEVLSCGPPDLEDVAHYRCQPLTGSGPAEELETLPYMVDLNVIEKAVLGRLLFRGALARIKLEIATAKTCFGKVLAALHSCFDIVLFWLMALIQLLFPVAMVLFVFIAPYCYGDLPDWREDEKTRPVPIWEK